MNELQEYLRQVAQFVRDNRNQLTPEQESRFAQILQNGFAKLDAMKAPPKPSNDATLLWILAGGNEDAFLNYLTQVGTPEAEQLLMNPEMLEQTLSQLNRFNPRVGVKDVENGIPISPLQSSNVYGSKYDPQEQKLRVRFQKGQVYEYDNVPPVIAKLFQSGAATAKTDGKNKFGEWWRGKNPSLGAATWKYLRGMNFPYQRVA